MAPSKMVKYTAQLQVWESWLLRRRLPWHNKPRVNATPNTRERGVQRSGAGDSPACAVDLI